MAVTDVTEVAKPGVREPYNPSPGASIRSQRGPQGAEHLEEEKGVASLGQCLTDQKWGFFLFF